MTTSFYAYLIRELPKADLVEITELFPKSQIQDLFIKEIDELLKTVPPGESREDLQRFREMDIVAFIDASLRRAGFRDFERDDLVSSIITKLLMGNFFKGFRQGSLVARFKASVSNAIATLVTRRNRQRHRSHELPTDLSSRSVADDGTLDHFRSWLRFRYSPLHQAVFDHRLGGGDTSELAGTHDLTGYRIKKIVREIKDAAKEFARNDPELLQMVIKAMETESATMVKRFGKAASR